MKKFLGLVGFLVLLGYAQLTWATTDVSGHITISDTWTVAGSPYRVTGDLTIDAGVTLTIDPGVIIKFRNPQDDLIVNGTLNAQGTSGNEIIFTSDEDDTAGGDTNNDASATTPAKGQWEGIRFVSGSRGTLDHFVVRYGGYSRIGALVYCDSSGDSPTITNGTITESANYGIFCDASSPTITNNTISGNSDDGISCVYCSPSITNNIISGNNFGISCWGSSPTITNNTITMNNARGIACENSSSPPITNNIITGNRSFGIYADGFSSPVISYNDVWNNSPNYSGCSAGPGDISADPLFVDGPGGDFHLQSTSPCIDAGAPSFDYSKEPQPNGGRINMGAYGNTPEAAISSSLAGKFLTETSSTKATLFETLLSQEAVLNNVTVSGDFNSTLDFTNFEIVTITTGSFAGKGFSKGEFETTLDGISYKGDWKGAVFLKPRERKIYLKGAVSGEISATVEGYLTESVPESGNYDQYQATWKIGHLGNTTTSTSSTINLNGTLSYQSSSEFTGTELYFLQVNMEGPVLGHYSDHLSIVLNHLRIADEGNPYYGQGFSMISYVSESGYNGLTKEMIVNNNYTTVYAYSGGTRTVLTAIRLYNLRCDRLVLISPMRGLQLPDTYHKELEQILESGKVKKLGSTLIRGVNAMRCQVSGVRCQQ